jgi:hypothetical protein
VRQVTVDVLDAAGCPSQPSGYQLVNVEVDGQEPECDLFAKLTPAVQALWLQEVPNDQYYGLTEPATAAEYIAACTGFAAGNLIAAGNYLKDFVSDGSFATWNTESKLGYTETVSLAVGAPLAGSSVPSATLATVKSACGFSADTDGLVPFYVFMEDTTSDKAPHLEARFSLSTSSSESLTTTATIAADFSSGPTCSAEATPYSPIDFSTTSTGKATSELGQKYTSWTSYATYWVVLKNWISPRNPGGAAKELAGYVLTGEAQEDASDPIVSSTTASIALNGLPAH